MENEKVEKIFNELGKDIVITRKLNPIITISDITLNLEKINFISQLEGINENYTIYFEGGFTKTLSNSVVIRKFLIKVWEQYYHQKTPN